MKNEDYSKTPDWNEDDDKKVSEYLKRKYKN